MDTVKVDLQKLQILNDRIAQTIDALNQVRVSVHGLSHTNPYAAQYGAAGFQGYGAYGPQQVQPQLGGFGPQQPQFVPVAPGLQHTSPWQGVPAYAYNPYAQQFGAQQFGAQLPFGPQLGFNPMMQGIQHTNPWYGTPTAVPQPWINPQMQPQMPQAYGGLPFGAGIQHTTAAIDPFQAMRLAQTFPNALYNVPTVTIF